MTAAIELRGIRKTFPIGEERVEILKGIDLRIDPGEFVAIMGPSGSGKSTLMNIMGLLDRPDSGSFHLEGREVSQLNEEDLAAARRETLGFVFQQFNLLQRLTALENTALPLLYSIKFMPKEPAMKLLKRVGLSERVDHRPTQLSGGQQQRVAIARALINHPRIIFADEPTGNLDSKSSAEILALIEELNREGITIVLVTHEAQVAAAARRIISIRDGRIESDVRKREEPRAESLSIPSISRLPSQGNRVLELFRQAALTLQVNKLRTFLSTLGVMIGVSAVIAMLAIGKGAQESIETQLSSLGSNLLNIRPASIRIGGVSTESDWLKLTLADADSIQRKIRGVRRAGPVVQANNVRVSYQDRNSTTTVYGVLPIYPKMHALVPELGRFFTDDETRQRALVGAIGVEVSKKLFGNANPIGKTIKVNRLPIRVIGILPEKGSSGFMNRDDQIEVPLDTAMYRLLGKNFVDMIEVEIEKGVDMSRATVQIDELLRSRHDIPLSQTEEAFRIFNLADIQNALTETSKTLSILLLVIAGISLLVGGIGIMNIMLVSVTERTREIGLRKAIGGTSSDILLQFLIESAAIGVLGGGVGVLFGILASIAVSLTAGWPVSISPLPIAVSFFFSSLVGMAFGIWPARRASQMNPIDALKGE